MHLCCKWLLIETNVNLSWSASAWWIIRPLRIYLQGRYLLERSPISTDNKVCFVSRYPWIFMADICGFSPLWRTSTDIHSKFGGFKKWWSSVCWIGTGLRSQTYILQNPQWISVRGSVLFQAWSTLIWGVSPSNTINIMYMLSCIQQFPVPTLGKFGIYTIKYEILL